MNNIIIIYLVTAATLLFASSSYAQLGQNLFQGNAKATALGNAVTADPPGVDSIHFNPAGLSRLKGRQFEVKLITGTASAEAEFIATDSYKESLKSRGYSIEDDAMANTKTSLSSFAGYMPGVGIVESPTGTVIPPSPMFGMSYTPPGSRFTFANAAYASMAGGYVREEDDPAAYYGQKAGLSRLTYFAPSVSFQATETLSLGVSVGFSYLGVGLELPVRFPNPLVETVDNLTAGTLCPDPNGGLQIDVTDFVDLCSGKVSPFNTLFSIETEMEDYFSVSYNLGLLWDATEWLTIGVAYQSGAKQRLEGDVTLEFDQGLTNLIGGLGSNGLLSQFGLDPLISYLEIGEGGLTKKGHVDLELPQQIALGFSIHVTPDLKFNIDGKWTETSVWDDIIYVVDEKTPVLEVLSDLAPVLGIEGVSDRAVVIPRGYEDVFNWALGVEYRFSDRLDLRAGYEPRKSGIPEDKMDFLIPVGDFNLYSLGFSYKTDRQSVFDLALAYLNSTQHIPAGTSDSGNNYSQGNFIYNPSAGLDTKMTLEAAIVEFSYRTTF